MDAYCKKITNNDRDYNQCLINDNFSNMILHIQKITNDVDTLTTKIDNINKNMIKIKDKL